MYYLLIVLLTCWCAASNRPSSQLTVWTRSQISRGHTCPPSLVVPHRSVTWSPPRPELEAMSRPPSDQVALPTPQGQQYTTCWPLEMSRHMWTLTGDASVIIDRLHVGDSEPVISHNTSSWSALSKAVLWTWSQATLTRKINRSGLHSFT